MAKMGNSQNHSTIENILRQFRELQGIDIFARQNEKWKNRVSEAPKPGFHQHKYMAFVNTNTCVKSSLWCVAVKH